ncbi:MAG: hypothetical protein JKY99_02400 [Rhizobiales bacterium]|nr:hypothetical protein [Hyphomicrobiales bacterium]
MSERPNYLSQGESARLFPVLSTTSKEGKATSILLACISLVDEFGRKILSTLDQIPARRAKIKSYTEIVFKTENTVSADRPDGLIVVNTRGKEWRALIEAKIGTAKLNDEQIERYRKLARENNIDCVVTISNQFCTAPNIHPIETIRKRAVGVPVFHWSWMDILTTTELLLENKDIINKDQAIILHEFRRFLSHESTGVRGYHMMPSEWPQLNKHVSANGKIDPKSEDSKSVLSAWHQEIRDLSLILSRQTGTPVSEQLSRKHKKNPSIRFNDELAVLSKTNQLKATLVIPDAAANLEIVADLSRRAFDVGMSIKAPEHRKSAKARTKWLINQINTDLTEDLHIQLNWPGKLAATLHRYNKVMADIGVVEKDRTDKQLLSFKVFYSRSTEKRFSQQTNFIEDLEKIVPDFYREIGQNLRAWSKPAPKIPPNKTNADDVDVASIAENSEKPAE